MRITRIVSLFGVLALIGTYYASAQPAKVSPTFTVRAYKSGGTMWNTNIKLQVKDAECSEVLLNYPGMTGLTSIESTNGKFPSSSPYTFTVTLPARDPKLPPLTDKSLRIYLTRLNTNQCVEVRAIHGDSGSTQMIAIVVP